MDAAVIVLLLVVGSSASRPSPGRTDRQPNKRPWWTGRHDRNRPGRWLRGFHPAPPGAPRLVCLPFAGGSASFFYPLSAALPARRGAGRAVPGTPGPVHASRRCATCTRSPTRWWSALPDDGARTVLFGHSMGALVGYEVARRLEGRGAEPRAPVRVGLARRRTAAAPAAPCTTLDDAGVLADVRTLGGPGARAAGRAASSWRWLLPAIRADYAAVELYEHVPRPAPALPGDGADRGQPTRSSARSRRPSGPTRPAGRSTCGSTPAGTST